MQDTFLRDYCLNMMGITQWRQNINIAQKVYLLVINEKLTQETTQLLSRMLQALTWQRALTQVEHLKEIDNDFLIKISQESFQKVLLLGETLNRDSLKFTANPLKYASLEIALLPALSVLLSDVEAKKKAWAIMQKL